MHKYFLLLLCCTHTASGQKLPPIQLDRPDQTECPFIVPRKNVQVEIGFTYQQTDRHASSIFMPSMLSKYGVNEKLELRLITELEQAKENGATDFGLNPVKIGFKTKLVEEKGWIPMISFIGHLSLPTIASEKYKAEYYAPSFRFTLQHTLSEKVSLGYNLGAEWDGFTPEPTFIYTLTSGFSLTEKLGSYVEVYGFIPQKDKADHRFDGGFTYLVNNDVMLDISGGAGFSKSSPDYYTSLGFSFRFR